MKGACLRGGSERYWTGEKDGRSRKTTVCRRPLAPPRRERRREEETGGREIEKKKEDEPEDVDMGGLFGDDDDY